jgi:cullin 4
MIDETLKLKRFADSSASGLFGAKTGDDTDTDALNQDDRVRFYDLRDAIHNGFKAGLGSRQNAPAEWIGT